MSNDGSWYIVWSFTKGAPAKRHEDILSAREEARRLCRMPENHGHEFFVFRACESVKYRTDPYVCRNFSRKDIKGDDSLDEFRQPLPF